MKTKHSMHLLFKLIVPLSLTSALFAQTLEPRLYSNAPTGLNFLVVGYAHTEGALAENIIPTLTHPKLKADIAVFAYARFLNVMGNSAKVDVIVPSLCLHGTATYQGAPATREVCGLGDIKGRFSVNLWGAPALSLKEFTTYKPDTIIGASVQVTAPSGQYDESKLVNISAHRWAIKPGLGLSKTISDFTVELATDVEFYSTNSDGFSGSSRKQAPLYSAQVHGIYNFMPGFWMGLDANYYGGGAYTTTTALGSKTDDPLKNSRYGATLALPVNRYNSVKLYANAGIFARTGTDFTMGGVTWQYRFGAGL